MTRGTTGTSELTSEERDRLVGELRPRYEADDTTIRSAVAYLRAVKN